MQVYSHQIDAPYVPVRIDLALPILDIPGCVEAHVDSDLSTALSSNDPNGVRIFCDAHMPSFNAMDYTPELLTFSRKPVIPRQSAPKQDQQTPPVRDVARRPPAPQPPAQQAAAPVPQPRVIMTRSRNKAEKEQGPAYNTRNRSKLKSNIN